MTVRDTRSDDPAAKNAGAGGTITIEHEPIDRYGYSKSDQYWGYEPGKKLFFWRSDGIGWRFDGVDHALRAKDRATVRKMLKTMFPNAKVGK